MLSAGTPSTTDAIGIVSDSCMPTTPARLTPITPALPPVIASMTDENELPMIVRYRMTEGSGGDAPVTKPLGQ